MNQERAPHHFGRGYMMQVLLHVGMSAVFTGVVECFLVFNISSYTSYLYQMGNDHPLVQSFAFAGLVSILLFVLLGIVLFTLSFLFLQRRTARDIETLAQAVKQISAGDFNTDISISGEGEIAHIAESIRMMEEELSRHIEMEKSNEQSKTDLITNIAHDLRTPLTSILGYLDLMKNNRSVNEEMKAHYLEIVYNKALRLQKLIEELFGFTKLSYGRMNMKLITLDLVQLLSQLLEENYPNFEKNGLSCDFSSNVKSLYIDGDGDLLFRLFDNLISNAIKYGAEGKMIKIRLRKEKQFVRVTVLNFGYIIPEKEIPLLFDKFYRVESSRSLSTGGTGLGLAIVKNIAEMHHGYVEAKSDLSGTRFIVTLPLRYEEEKKPFEGKKESEEEGRKERKEEKERKEREREKKRKDKSKKNTLLMLFLFFLCFFSIRAHSESLNLNLNYGVQNTAKAGKNLPLQLSIENTEEKTFSGTLNIILAESGKHLIQYSYPLVVEGNSTKEMDKNFMLPSGVNQLLFSIENLNKEQIVYRRVGLDISGSDAELLIAVLSEKGENIGFLQNARINDGLLETRVLSFTEENFPKEESDLYLLDLLIIRDFDLYSLDKQVRDGLKHYVEHGGVLLFSLSDNALHSLPEDFSSYLSTDLDFQNRSIHLKENQTEGEESKESLMSSPVYLKGGREGAFSDGIPFLSVTPMGNGLLAVLGYDLYQLERYATEDSSYVGRLFLDIYGQNRLDNLSISASEKSLKQYWDLEELMNLSDLSKLPSVPLYFGVLLVYLALVGPGIYFFLRSQNSLRVYRPAIILLSLITVILVWAMGIGTRFNGNFLTYVKLIQLNESNVDEENYINLRSPASRNFSLGIKAEYTVNPILKGVDFTGDLGELRKEKGLEKTLIEQEREKSIISVQNAESFSSHYFLLNKKVPNSIGKLEGRVQYFGGKISGEIKNNTEYTLSDAFILLYGRVIKLGKLEKGQSLNLSRQESIPVPLGDFDYLANLLFSGNSKNFVRYILGDEIHGYFSDARFFAIIREDSPGFTEELNHSSDTHLEKYGTSVVASSLMLSRTEGDKREYSALSRDPIIASGEYDSSTNTMNPMIPLEIRYDLGEEENISSIAFERMDVEGNNLLMNFQGNMAIYNNRTGGYDSIGREEGVLSGDRLKTYLNEKNELRLRFVSREATASPEIRQLLPMITVTAKEKKG